MGSGRLEGARASRAAGAARVATDRSQAHGGERAGHSLQPTALVNEAYLRLIDLERVKWQNRAHFFAMPSRMMRRVLVDVAGAKGYRKRGGGAQRLTFIDSKRRMRRCESSCAGRRYQTGATSLLIRGVFQLRQLAAVVRVPMGIQTLSAPTASSKVMAFE